MANDPEQKRTLAERARDAWQAAQQRVADLRIARARGGEDAPSATEMQSARDAAELAEDRARLAELAAEEAARAKSEADALEAARQHRAHVLAVHAATRPVDARVAAAAEELAEALVALRAQSHALAHGETGLGHRWFNGRMTFALEAVAAAWPLDLAMVVNRPMPLRPPEVRAQHAAMQARWLSNFLPIPPDPDAPAVAPDAAA